MGGIKFRVLSDLARVDAHVGARCLKCGHYAVLDRHGILQLFHKKGWNEAMEVAGSYFRCRKCGHLGAEVRAVKLNQRDPIEPPKVLWER